MSTQTEPQTTKVVTGLVRFSYANVFEPKAMDENEEKKYSSAILIDKTDKVTLSKIERAIKAAIEGGKSKLGDKPGKLKLPLRDGDEERPDDENYAGKFFLNANSKNKPSVVDKAMNKIIDPDEFYSGCYGHASLTFYAFAGKSKGVAVGLNHVMKTKDGERLGGGTSAENDFADLVSDDLLG